MKTKLLILILGITLTSLGMGAEARRCWLTPAPVILLTEGVEGGIAPLPVPFQMVVRPAADSSSRVYVLRRQNGKTIYTQGNGPNFAALQKELTQLGLYELPQEKEPGLADPYGMRTALHSHDGTRCWINEPPTGCIRGAPGIAPTAEQKATFANAVKRLEGLAARALEPLSEKEYQAVFSELYPARQ